MFSISQIALQDFYCSKNWKMTLFCVNDFAVGRRYWRHRYGSALTPLTIASLLRMTTRGFGQIIFSHMVTQEGVT